MNHSHSSRPTSLTLAERCRPIVLLIIVGLIPVVSGLSILYWQVERSLQRASVDAGRRAITHLDRTLERADDLTARATSLVGQDCAEVLDPMRRLVNSYPAVRSMVLGDRDKLYCGSELGAVDQQLSAEMLKLDKLLLRASSLPSPDRGSMLFRRYQGQYSLNAVIDAQVLAEVLNFTGNGVEILLEHNGLLLSKDARLLAYDYADHGEHHAVQISALYGYRVHSGFAPGYSLQAFKAQFYPMLGTLLLLGVVTAGVCHWLSRQKTVRR